MTYRAGNLDTPDDCVEKRDMDILLPYRPAREKSGALWKRTLTVLARRDCRILGCPSPALRSRSVPWRPRLRIFY